MTTGRINQVTILTGQAAAPKGDGPGEPPGRRSGLVKRSGARPKPVHPARETPEAEAQGISIGHPIAPTEFPRGWSAHSMWGFATRNAGPLCGIHALEGGYQPPVTPGDGYELRLTPECLTDNDGHRPIIHRLRQSLRDEPRRSSNHPRPAAVFRGRANVRQRHTYHSEGVALCAQLAIRICMALPYGEPSSRHPYGGQVGRSTTRAGVNGHLFEWARCI